MGTTCTASTVINSLVLFLSCTMKWLDAIVAAPVPSKLSELLPLELESSTGPMVPSLQHARSDSLSPTVWTRLRGDKRLSRTVHSQLCVLPRTLVRAKDLILKENVCLHSMDSC